MLWWFFHCIRMVRFRWKTFWTKMLFTHLAVNQIYAYVLLMFNVLSVWLFGIPASIPVDRLEYIHKKCRGSRNSYTNHVVERIPFHFPLWIGSINVDVDAALTKNQDATKPKKSKWISFLFWLDLQFTQIYFFSQLEDKITLILTYI